MSTPLPRRPMTEAERRMAEALGRCRFTPGTFDKRWCQSIAYVAVGSDPTLTEKEARLLPEMVLRYRRQIPADVVRDLAQLEISV